MSDTPNPDGVRLMESTVAVGTVINNNYRITDLMSIGGMGEVFCAVNTFTGDPVAIKIVLKELAHDANITALFKREAKVLCGLSDQAIVRYFNFVKDTDLDRYCLIMEFVDGTVLSDHVDDVAPLSVEQATRLMRRLATGLAEVHAADVVHRDLSPDNVILRGDDIDAAVLIDFGIAKSTVMTDKTMHGQLAGKFKFISPEQLGHFGGEIGPTTDIYGLALMIAYALQGKPLEMGNSVVEAVEARRQIPDLRHFDPQLRALLAHMLEPSPRARPASMRDVIALLDDPSLMPAKYRALGPKLDTKPVDDGAIDTVFQPPSYIPGQIDGSGMPSQPRPMQKTGIGALRWIGVLALLAGVGWFGLTQQDVFAPAPPVADPETVSVEEAPVENTRAAFLANYGEGQCAVATRIAAGPQAGTIAAFAADLARFDGLAPAYDAAFDAQPTVRRAQVDPAQCAVLDLGRALAIRGGSAPVLTLDSDVMISDGTIIGRLSDRRGRPVWLALVTTAGGVYTLTDRLEDQPDGSVTFRFGLTRAAGDAAQPQLIIAVASDAPLIAAAAAAEGTEAASLLPLIEAEVAARDGAAGMAITTFELIAE